LKKKVPGRLQQGRPSSPKIHNVLPQTFDFNLFCFFDSDFRIPVREASRSVTRRNITTSTMPCVMYGGRLKRSWTGGSAPNVPQWHWYGTTFHSEQAFQNRN
jgi:hypothetical protein